ncbi:MAG: UDP-glucuronic acid decarboxylase family protein [Pseudomonadota bacterium]
MNVLLTGAAGFVGSHLCDRLIEAGYRVTAVDNLITGRLDNIEHLLGEARFTFVLGDACDVALPGERWDAILHFASPASPPKYQAYPLQTLRINSMGTHRLLDLACASEARFVLASTSEVYGDAEVHPQQESYWGNVNPIGPRSVYDEAKRYAECLVSAYHRRLGLRSCIVRIFNTYGPRMDPMDGRVVSNFVTRALAGRPLHVYGEGRQTRSFQYVDDLVDGVLRCMHEAHHGPINLGNPHEVSVLALANLVIELTRSDSVIEHWPCPEDDPVRRRPDISRARRELGWAPAVGLRDGLRHTVRYFAGQGGWQRPARKIVDVPVDVVANGGRSRRESPSPPVQRRSL